MIPYRMDVYEKTLFLKYVMFYVAKVYFLFIYHIKCRLAGDSGKSMILGYWVMGSLLAFNRITRDTSSITETEKEWLMINFSIPGVKNILFIFYWPELFTWPRKFRAGHYLYLCFNRNLVFFIAIENDLAGFFYLYLFMNLNILK